MHNSKNKKRNRILILLLIIIPLGIINFNTKRWNSNNNDNINEEFDEINYLDEYPKLSSYPISFNGTGENLNITLHQSYLNESFNTILNTSIIDGNNFTIPSPTDTKFNSSYTKIEVEDIIAPNKSLIIEDEEIQSNAYELFLTYYFGSFQVEGDCYLANISVLVSSTVSQNFNIHIYNATWTGSYIQYDDPVAIGSRTIPSVSHSNLGWENVTNWNVLLNASESKTYNKTFFIRLGCDTGGDGYWHYGANGAYDSILWRLGGGAPLLPSNDFGLKVYLSPINNTPRPEQINLRINNKPINKYNDIDNIGYWESFDVNSSASGKLKYNLTADWWDVECNISQVQINYTKTNLKASSKFNIEGSGDVVTWNVTRVGGLNNFDSRFSNYQINFTIPATWLDSSIKVFNGSDDRTSSIIKQLLGNGYREIKIPNAGNGVYWFLNATSSNLISSIATYVGSSPINDIANYTNIVRFNATFNEIIGDGNINLRVYSPVPNYLNHTNIVDISTLSPDTEFNVSDWDISIDADQYGIFTTYLAWNNGTAAGFLMGNLTVFGEAELTFLNLPPLTFDASDVFNITAFFNDTGYMKFPPRNISDGDISYSINSNDFRTDNIVPLGDGLYNITIDCNDGEFNSNGPNSITINASKQFYNNQSKTIDIVILAETSLTIIRPLNGAIFDSSDTFNITIKYNNTVRSEIIDSPNINYSLDGGNTYRWDNIKSIGDNKYNITVNCTDAQFGNYGLQNIIVNASKSYYYNQSESFSITITGDTSLALTKWPDQSFYYSDEVLNITAHFNDTAKNQGIDGANVQIYV
ncbi:MAG: hypothetical protein ACFE9T_16290, partial [Promethearchaeota archaeon]